MLEIKAQSYEITWVKSNTDFETMLKNGKREKWILKNSGSMLLWKSVLLKVKISCYLGNQQDQWNLYHNASNSFSKTEKNYPKICVTPTKNLKIDIEILNKKRNSESSTFPYFKVHCKAVEI